MMFLQTKHFVVFSLLLGIVGLLWSCRMEPKDPLDRRKMFSSHKRLVPALQAPVRIQEVEALTGGMTLERVNQLSDVKITEEVYLKMAQSGALWDLVRDQKNKQIINYIELNQEGFQAFRNGPVAFNGAPAIVFVLLQRVMPEIFGAQAFEASVGLKAPEKNQRLPRGMAFTKPPKNPPDEKFPGETSSLAVTFTCAACHLQDALTEDGREIELVGAQNRRFDINRYRQMLIEAVQSPRYDVKIFSDLLGKISAEDLYGAAFVSQAQGEKAAFLAQNSQAGGRILAAFKEETLNQARLTQETLGQYSYHGDQRFLESSPGKVEAFGFATLALLPSGSLEKDRQGTLERYLPKNPSVADIMSVWQQNKRTYSQWDGSLKVKLLRNLGAELGIAADPAAVNLANAQATTGFLGDLPAPPYPFRVDLHSAVRGRKIFQTTCGGCHDHERFVELKTIGTEPGRASGLTAGARELLIGGLRAACQNSDPAICGAPDPEVLVARQEKPGYQALPLSGIWARGPYFHNGSVPTLKQILIPSSRASVFRVGRLEFDQTQVGFDWQLPAPGPVGGAGPGGLQVDTSRLGYGSFGHSDPQVFGGGYDFSQEPGMVSDLLEYLKTL